MTLLWKWINLFIHWRLLCWFSTSTLLMNNRYGICKGTITVGVFFSLTEDGSIYSLLGRSTPSTASPLTLDLHLTKLAHLARDVNLRRVGLSSMASPLCFQMLRSEVAQSGRELGARLARMTTEGGPSTGGHEGCRPPREDTTPRAMTAPPGVWRPGRRQLREEDYRRALWLCMVLSPGGKP
jgi:hypothetical protein